MDFTPSCNYTNASLKRVNYTNQFNSAIDIKNSLGYAHWVMNSSDSKAILK